MIRVLLGVLALLRRSLRRDAGGAGAGRSGPTLTPLWNLTGDFAAPESAYYDAASNAVFVSSINGQILEKRRQRLHLAADAGRQGGEREVGHRPERAEGPAQRRRRAVGVRHRRGGGHRHRAARAITPAREDRGRAVPERPGDGARRHRLRVGLDHAARSTRCATARRRCSSRAATWWSSRTGCWWTAGG